MLTAAAGLAAGEKVADVLVKRLGKAMNVKILKADSPIKAKQKVKKALDSLIGA